MFTCGIYIRLLCIGNCSDGKSRDGTDGVKNNSRSVALAARVVAGLVNEDFDVQLLSAWSSEYNGECEIVDEGLTDHGRGLSSMWLKERILTLPLAGLYMHRGRRRHFMGHAPWWR